MNKVLQNIRCEKALRLITSGDMNGLAEIYTLLGKEMYALALSIVKDHHLAEDLVQDTLADLALCAKDQREKSSAVAFCMTVLRNNAISLLRKRSFEQVEEELPEIAVESSMTEEDAMVQMALDQLSLEDRQLVLLRAVSGLSYKEIADQLGVPPQTLRKRYERAMRTLKVFCRSS